MCTRFLFVQVLKICGELGGGDDGVGTHREREKEKGVSLLLAEGGVVFMLLVDKFLCFDAVGDFGGERRDGVELRGKEREGKGGSRVGASWCYASWGESSSVVTVVC